MKRVALAAVILSVAGFALGNSVIVAPSSMLGTRGLDGTYAYTWTVGSGPFAPDTIIDSATITFTDIMLRAGANDISVDLGRVFQGMAAAPSHLPAPGTAGKYLDSGVSTDAFNQNVTSGNAVHLGTQFLVQGVDTSWSYTLTSAELASLNKYISGSWGFLVDPDGVLDVGNITFAYTYKTNTASTPVGGTTEATVPDGGATAPLLGAAMLFLGWAKRRLSAQLNRKPRT